MHGFYRPAAEGAMKPGFISSSWRAVLECPMPQGRAVRQRMLIGVAAALLIAVAPVGSQRVTWTFEDLLVGRPPAGFDVVSTGEGGVGRWELLRDGQNVLLAQLASVARARGFRMAIAQTPTLRDLSLSVRFRGLEGERAAGIVWRYVDENHYYLARVSLSDQEVGLYKVVRGNRIRLDCEDDLELDRAAWHTLKIEHRDEQIRLWLDGIPVDGTRDRTLDAAGRVGVWTTADSAAWFDDLSVAGLAEDRR